MVETYLIIYALGTITIILATILGAKAVKRRTTKSVNIWEGNAKSPVSSRFQAPSAMPIAPPPPHFFNNR